MEKNIDWTDIRYLLEGDTIQKQVYKAIHNCRAMELLAAFDPVLTGTYPIGIYLPDSDIDIICAFSRQAFFENVVLNAFAYHDDFNIIHKLIRGEECIIARFKHSGFLFEVFGQEKPVNEQYAFRHMIVEHRLLAENDALFRKKILSLKEKGLSTEEAFCTLLGIEGDPYENLLQFE